MIVDIQHVKSLQEELARINSIPLEELELYDGDTRIIVSPEILDDWKFIGLSNITFIELEAWNGFENV
ncbi:MAG: hypothetical protein KGI50_06885 [Patescibacteria group bacterium]|nr:hypothetical protein [Patescibacteria group bacterium]